MPVKKENRARYPSNWQTVREQILVRACHRCECCGAPQYGVGQWVDDRFLLARGGAVPEQLYYALSHAAAREIADRLNASEQPERPYIVIVLTIAHLDHTPENCDPSNLRALCQRHHLAYDAKHHRTNAAATRRAKKLNRELFVTEE
jgi:hypothetical protein